MKIVKKCWKWALKHKPLLVVLVIFALELFTRTYQLNLKNPFGYDQVDNAWAAKNIIVNHWYPLVGMVAKADSGIYIGPVYYYFVAFFYWIFNLNPMAIWAIAVVTDVVTFWVLYYIIKKLFNPTVAIIALIINTFSLGIIIFDGIQWPVQFLPIVSLIIFYLLYKVILGDVKKLIPLALFIGLAFNLHFTAIFFPIIVILTLPFFPRTKQTLKYILLALPFFVVWLVPNFIYAFFVNRTYNTNETSYLSTYSHGFHLRRMLQLVGDALIQFDSYLALEKLKPLKVLLLPLFFILYLFKPITTEKKKFLYLVFLWFMVPWVIFTIYSGEISDYYFVANRFIVLFILAYFIYLIWNFKHLLAKIAVVVFLIAYFVWGLMIFLPYKDEGSLQKQEQEVQQVVSQGGRIEFQIGVSKSYLYYYYMRQKGIEVYVSKYR
jgi:4-amino-4-deoxy-L-arabinose transferase-like glycosyltransferase